MGKVRRVAGVKFLSMKIFGKIVFFISLIALVVFVGSNLFLNTKVKDVITTRLSESFNKRVTVRRLRWQWPLTLGISGFSFDGKNFVKEAQLRIGFSDLSKEGIHITQLKLIEPLVYVQRTKEGEVEFAGFSLKGKEAKRDASGVLQPSPQSLESRDPVLKEKERELAWANLIKPQLRIDRFVIQNGQINFSDLSSEKVFQVSLENVQVTARNVEVPLDRDINTPFSLKASLHRQGGWPVSAGVINSSGWINIKRKDMEVDLDVMKPDGDLGLTAKLVSRDNAMRVKGNINLTDLNAVIQPPSEEDRSSFENLFWGTLGASGLRISTDFVFDTKMDDFRVRKVALSGDVGFNSESSSQKEGDAAVEDQLNDMGKHFEAFGKKLYEEVIKQTP